MGFNSISPMSLLLIFLIVIILFGTKKIRNIGEDLGHAFKSFRKGLQQIVVVVVIKTPSKTKKYKNVIKKY